MLERGYAPVGELTERVNEITAASTLPTSVSALGGMTARVRRGL